MQQFTKASVALKMPPKPSLQPFDKTATTIISLGLVWQAQNKYKH